MHLPRISLLLVVCWFGGCDAPAKQTQSAPESKLVVTSKPSGAAVFENGRDRLGVTPLTLTRDEGRRVQLTLVKKGYKRARRAIFLGPRKSGHHSLHVTFSKAVGTLVVDTLGVRGARVEINGVYRGRAPRRFEVVLGTHEVVISKRGLPTVRRTVEIKEPLQKINLEVRLAPKQAIKSGPQPTKPPK